MKARRIATIFAEQGLSRRNRRLCLAAVRLPRPDVPTDQAAEELAQAVALLVERPALEAALAAATDRFEHELSEGAFAEQQRLLKRKLEFEARLGQMASRASGRHTGTAAAAPINDMAE